MKEEKIYKLTKEGDGEFAYLDQDGCSWDSPEGWLFTGILGGCGCGSSEDFGKDAVVLLEHFNTGHFERTLELYERPYMELMAHWFDSKDLIEHGTSIGGSWLTDKGKNICEQIKQFN